MRLKEFSKLFLTTSNHRLICINVRRKQSQKSQMPAMAKTAKQPSSATVNSFVSSQQQSGTQIAVDSRMRAKDPNNSFSWKIANSSLLTRTLTDAPLMSTYLNSNQYELM